MTLTGSLLKPIEEKADEYLEKEDHETRNLVKAILMYLFEGMLDACFLIGVVLVIVLSGLSVMNWFREKFHKY